MKFFHLNVVVLFVWHEHVNKWPHDFNEKLYTQKNDVVNIFARQPHTAREKAIEATRARDKAGGCQHFCNSHWTQTGSTLSVQTCSSVDTVFFFYHRLCVHCGVCIRCMRPNWKQRVCGWLWHQLDDISRHISWITFICFELFTFFFVIAHWCSVVQSALRYDFLAVGDGKNSDFFQWFCRVASAEKKSLSRFFSSLLSCSDHLICISFFGLLRFSSIG